jgi:hypothetical protein
VGGAQSEIERASKEAEGDARYYTSHIEIARIAERGLYGEYADILRSVALLELRDDAIRGDLITRIYDYINKEILRPALGGAIEHLKEGRSALVANAESVFIFASTAERRNFAIGKFDDMVEKLDRFYKRLGPDQGGSAVAPRSLTP